MSLGYLHDIIYYMRIVLLFLVYHAEGGQRTRAKEETSGYI